jgi:hypothetical protein
LPAGNADINDGRKLSVQNGVSQAVSERRSTGMEVRASMRDRCGSTISNGSSLLKLRIIAASLAVLFGAGAVAARFVRTVSPIG